MKAGEADVFWARVKKSDGCWEWTGYRMRGSHNYGFISYCGVATPAHRISYMLTHGPIPPGMVIDHICCNPPCVNPDHLRAITQKQNLEHRQGANRNSASGVLGVSWAPRAKKWRGQVHHHQVRVHVGYFSDLEEAAAAVAAKRRELFTHNDADRTG